MTGPVDGFDLSDDQKANFLPNNAPGRTLNGAAFQPSPTRPVKVSYVVEITASATVAGGQSGIVELLADPVNPPTTVRRSARNAFTITLGIGIAWTHISRWCLEMEVPKGWYVRLVTTGTATMTLVQQEETIQ